MQTHNRDLSSQASLLPTEPGVYLFLDERGRTLYIGKAKNLRARVQSYFREFGDGRPQIPRLMARAAKLDSIVTGSEIEALVTEANLIRDRKPPYNVRLKDDKRYPYVRITNESFPRIFLTRTIIDDGSRYLGPYTDVRAVRKTLDLVYCIFPLRHCRSALESQLAARTCMNYQIGKCCGPCVGHVTREEYRRLAEDAWRFMSGRNTELIADLRARMRDASDAMEFEMAANIRDTIGALQKVNERRLAFSPVRLSGEWDVVNFHISGDEASMVIMEVREGNVLDKKDYHVGGIQYASRDEALAQFLAQYYLTATGIPPEVHLPEHPSDEVSLIAFLRERRGGTFRFAFPKRGEKARLLAMAAHNAEMILNRTIERRDRQKDAVPHAVAGLQKDLRLDHPPRTIACIDISHLHGSDTVGSLVYFRDGMPLKREYRRFRIGTVEGIDDFAAIREVVRRYYRRRVDEGAELPDLLLVDGGKGQLSSAVAALNELGLDDRPAAGLAKRLEEVFLPGMHDPQNIPKTSPALRLLQRVRDEAHRFAVSYQRTLRRKRTIASSLTSIPGVGGHRAADLLRAFGSVRAIREAGETEIAAVPGIGPVLAAVVKRHLAGV